MSRVLAIVVLAAAPANADEGEFLLAGAVVLDGAWLVHPAATGTDFPSLGRASFTPALRAGGTMQVGLTNEAHLGAGLEGELASNVITNDVRLGGGTAQLVTGAYMHVAAPLRASWRIDSGYDVTCVVALDAGPLFTAWNETAAADSTKLDDAGRPARLPLEVADAWEIGGLVRLNAMVDWRLFENVAVRVGPSASFSFAGSPGAHVGISFEPVFLGALGPH